MKKTILFLSLLTLLPAAFFPCGAFAEQTVFFGPFEAENMRGEDAITEAIFAESEITIVNLWTTWCPSCITELPDLAGLSEATDGRAQVLGVLLDGITLNNQKELTRDQFALDTMHALLDNCGAMFAVVLPEDPFLLGLASITSTIPTSFIVGSDGEILGRVVGGRSAQQWIEIIEKAREGNGK